MTYYINKDNSHNPAPSLPSNTIPTSSRTLQEPTSNIMSARGIIGGKKRKYMSRKKIIKGKRPIKSKKRKHQKKIKKTLKK